MKPIKRTAALAALFFVTTATAAPVDLRGPAPTPGATITTTADSETENGTLNMTVQGQVMQGQMKSVSQHVIEAKVLEVTDGTPTKVQNTYVKAKTTNTMTMFGQAQTQDDTTMQGTVLVQTRTEDGWVTEVKEGRIPPEAADVIKKASYTDPRLAYPDKPVDVGGTWKIKDEQIAAFMGQGSMPGAKFDGEISFELVKLKTVDGQQIAVIDYKMDTAMLMDMNQQGMDMDMKIKMVGKGTIERNLASYTTDSDFKGDMDLDITMSMNGQPMMTTTAKMPVKGTSKQKAE